MSPPTRPRLVLINAGRLDWAHELDLSALSAISEVVRHDSDADAAEIVKRAVGATILVTKEIPVPGEAIRAFPPSVKLIVEAGTGFNNVDLAAAKEKNITVCNVAGYSSDAVATLVMSFILDFSSGLGLQRSMLARADMRNYSGPALKTPHFEARARGANFPLPNFLIDHAQH